MTRKYLSERAWRELFEAQGECCAHCTNVDGPFEADHSSLVAFGNNQPPDQILCVPCHKAKTRRDKAKIAKANRIRGKTRSKWNGDKPTRKIQSRGFPKHQARTREQIMGQSK